MLTLSFMLILLAATAKAAPPKKRAPHHSHRFLVAQKLSHGLAGTPLNRLGFEFEKAGWHAWEHRQIVYV